MMMMWRGHSACVAHVQCMCTSVHVKKGQKMPASVAEEEDDDDDVAWP
jgi:hypothetical protein